MRTYNVNVNGVAVKTTVTDSVSFVDSFITELILSCNYTNSSSSRPPIIGFDVEFTESAIDGIKAATLQICSGSRCIIIQLNKTRANNSVPQSLINFLAAPLFCFVGVGIFQSLALLKREHGIECRNVVDLRLMLNMAVARGAVELEPKPLSVVTGDWVLRILAWSKSRVLLLMLFLF
ncbi:uncharacterized protein Pyn_40497 [Prunus yedoensis var. nudiflora]|uniref:3'-5' exonuclease domain-containing protein n=1 Tax=Prunus yedoensis var. nudiflora TaxID=2094558 RepID=A0A314YA16_PRUYE|nr:uncharacterized protein Pyn_40497 [Prunus yedoensis var. nudiflora]